MSLCDVVHFGFAYKYLISNIFRNKLNMLILIKIITTNEHWRCNMILQSKDSGVLKLTSVYWSYTHIFMCLYRYIINIFVPHINVYLHTCYIPCPIRQKKILFVSIHAFQWYLYPVVQFDPSRTAGNKRGKIHSLSFANIWYSSKLFHLCILLIVLQSNCRTFSVLYFVYVVLRNYINSCIF